MNSKNEKDLEHLYDLDTLDYMVSDVGDTTSITAMQFRLSAQLLLQRTNQPPPTQAELPPVQKIRYNKQTANRKFMETLLTQPDYLVASHLLAN